MILSMTDESDLPLPLVETSSDEMMREVFPNGPSDQDPFGAAFIWKRELCSPDGDRSEVTRLTYNPAWWDFDGTGRDLLGWGIASGVVESENAPGRIAYVKLIKVAGATTRAFADATLTDHRLLVMVKQGSIWKAWGVSEVGMTSVGTDPIIEILDRDAKNR